MLYSLYRLYKPRHHHPPPEAGSLAKYCGVIRDTLHDIVGVVGREGILIWRGITKLREGLLNCILSAIPTLALK